MVFRLWCLSRGSPRVLCNMDVSGCMCKRKQSIFLIQLYLRSVSVSPDGFTRPPTSHRCGYVVQYLSSDGVSTASDRPTYQPPVLRRASLTELYKTARLVKRLYRPVSPDLNAVQMEWPLFGKRACPYGLQGRNIFTTGKSINAAQVEALLEVQDFCLIWSV